MSRTNLSASRRFLRGVRLPIHPLPLEPLRTSPRSPAETRVSNRCNRVPDFQGTGAIHTVWRRRRRVHHPVRVQLGRIHRLQRQLQGVQGKRAGGLAGRLARRATHLLHLRRRQPPPLPPPTVAPTGDVVDTSSIPSSQASSSRPRPKSCESLSWDRFRTRRRRASTPVQLQAVT
jgi:hypothetical protein